MFTLEQQIHRSNFGAGAGTGVTASANDNSTKLATTEYVQTELTDLIGGVTIRYFKRNNRSVKQ